MGLEMGLGDGFRDGFRDEFRGWIQELGLRDGLRG